MLLFLASCGNAQASEPISGSTSILAATSGADAATVDADPAAATDVDPAAATGGGKILIAYFTVAENSEVDAISSASVPPGRQDDRGYVRILAEHIQTAVGGDLFSIRTSTQYPGNITDVINEAADEQDADARPELTAHVENLDEYDTIFIGYPNWWADLPMVVYSFLEEVDLSGKTIIPFCVHNGSGFSSTIETIRELEPGAVVLEDGFTVNQRGVTDAAGDVADWLQGMEISVITSVREQ